MDGQITVLSGKTFSDFVAHHRSQLIRVVAVAGRDVPSAVAAVDSSLSYAERRWDRFDADPFPVVLARAVSSLQAPENLPEPNHAFDELPFGQRLDAILVNHLNWTPSQRRQIGAVSAPHAEGYDDIIRQRLGELGVIPNRPDRSNRAGLRLFGIAAAVLVGAAALITAGNIGGPTPLASIPTLPPLDPLAAVPQDRAPRLMGAPQLEWSQIDGVNATHFLQIGDRTYGYLQSTDGLHAWSTDDGTAWTDHGIVLEIPLELWQMSEGGPGGIALFNAPWPETHNRLYSTADGTTWTRHVSSVVEDAVRVTLVASSGTVSVISTLEDQRAQWEATVVDRLSDVDRAAADEFGQFVQASDVVILGPFGGPAKRIPLADLGVDVAESPAFEVDETVWRSTDLETWTAVETPHEVVSYFADAMVGTRLAGGEVAIPVRGSTDSYIVANSDGDLRAVSSTRLVEHLALFGDDVIGVSNAYPLPQIVRSTDLADWVSVSPDLRSLGPEHPERVLLETGDAGLAAVFVDFQATRIDEYTVEVRRDDFFLSFRAPDGALTISRDGEVVAQLVTVYDERLVVHDFETRTITILDPATLDPILTIPFGTASLFSANWSPSFGESIDVLFTGDGVEWSVEQPPIRPGSPIHLNDVHVGNGIVVLTVSTPGTPDGPARVLVGRPRDSSASGSAG